MIVSEGNQGEVTRLLLEWRHGDPRALERLTPMVYEELKRLAHHYMRDERKERVLQTTALVHEAYLRLTGLDLEWEGRGHFVAVAAQLMRRILVDAARRRQAEKRGGGDTPEALTDGLVDRRQEDTTLALHEALVDLERLDPRKHRVIELKYFGGATVTEIATILEVATRTVERDLRLARAWLAQALGVNALGEAGQAG
jgi:RNA polymerase sigma-70 factor, ECF subfamily